MTIEPMIVAADAAAARAALVASGLFVEGEGDFAGLILPAVEGAGYEDYGGAGITPPPVVVDPGDPLTATPVPVEGYHVNAWAPDCPEGRAAWDYLSAAGLLVDPEPSTPWCALAR